MRHEYANKTDSGMAANRLVLEKVCTDSIALNMCNTSFILEKELTQTFYTGKLNDVVAHAKSKLRCS